MRTMTAVDGGSPSIVAGRYALAHSGGQLASGRANASDIFELGVQTTGDASDDGRSSIQFRTTVGTGGSDSAIGFWTNKYGTARAERMTIDKDGNVGIGTASPGLALDISRTSSGAEVRNLILRNAGDGSANSGVALELDPTNNGPGVRTAQIAAITNGNNQIDMVLRTADANPPVERVRIRYNGNVGIGTAAPSARLHTAGGNALHYGSGSGNPFAMQIGRADGTTDVSIGIPGSAGQWALSSVPGDLVIRTEGTTRKMLFDTSGGSGTPALTILGNDGNVGIGTSAPANAKLDVRDTNTIVQVRSTMPAIVTGNNNGGALYFGVDNANTATAPTAAIETSWGGATNPQIGIGVTRGGLKANILMDFNSNTSIRTGATTALYVQGATGNVGIGTTTPDQGKLEVRGGSVCVDTNSDDNATSCITAESDVRLKKNIEVIPHALATLEKLRGVLFDWRWDEYPQIKDYKAIGRDAGVIAQEVEAAFPQGMGEEVNGFKTVRYDRLVPLLIESVKELKAANDNLKADNDNQAEAIEDLRREIEALKAAR